MNADKRAVATDALQTLGTIIGPSEKRDAIHLAVEPVIAAQRLNPGESVGFIPGGVGRCDNPVGIVDPFLAATVSKGQRFWLVVYPRQITSLRHVWTHPAFPEETTSAVTTIAPTEDDAQANSRRWIEEFADRLDVTYSRLMRAANDWLLYENYEYDNSETYKNFYEEFSEFWTHYAIVTGADVPSDKRESFFACSC